MILKGKEYKYQISYVSKGMSRDAKPWTRFSIYDYDKLSQQRSYISVLVFEDVDVQDGDQISFKEYNAGAKKFRGKDQLTLFVSEGDLIVHHNSGSSGLDVNVEELPF